MENTIPSVTQPSDLAKRIAEKLEHWAGRQDAGWEKPVVVRMAETIAEHIAPLEAELKIWKPMTPEEAEAEIAAIESGDVEPLSQQEINEMLAKVMDPTYQPPEYMYVKLLAKARQLEKLLREACKVASFHSDLQCRIDAALSQASVP